MRHGGRNFAIQSHQPGGEIGQTRFILDGKCPVMGYCRFESGPGCKKRKMMNRPVIFLDFDGVLNTEQYHARLAVEGKPNKDAWGRCSTLAPLIICAGLLTLPMLRLSFPHHGDIFIASAACA